MNLPVEILARSGEIIDETGLALARNVGRVGVGRRPGGAARRQRVGGVPPTPSGLPLQAAWEGGAVSSAAASLAAVATASLAASLAAAAAAALAAASADVAVVEASRALAELLLR